jgi:MurNAc alpha-1-phosphate uridylyltransferase
MKQNRPRNMPKSAMVLAAGLGLRMRPLTESRPKPLVSVAGQPLIEHIFKPIEAAGVSRIVMNVHYLADQLRAHIAARAGADVIISDETARLMDSGGGIKKALSALGHEPFFVLNGDSFWIDGPRPNLMRLAEAWEPERMDILLLVVASALATGYEGKGDFTMEADGRLHRRVERHVAPFVYAGVGIMKPELFSDTPEGPFSLKLIFDRAISAEKLFGLRLDGEWLHVGTPNAIEAAEMRLRRSTL